MMSRQRKPDLATGHCPWQARPPYRRCRHGSKPDHWSQVQARAADLSSRTWFAASLSWQSRLRALTDWQGTITATRRMARMTTGLQPACRSCPTGFLIAVRGDGGPACRAHGAGPAYGLRCITRNGRP